MLRFLPLLAALLIFGAACSGEAVEPAPRPTAAPEEVSDAPARPAGSLTQELDDAALAVEVHKALLDTSALRPFDFEIEAQRGRITLRGYVATDSARQLAAEVAAEVRGVEAVANELALTSDTLAAPIDSVQAAAVQR